MKITLHQLQVFKSVVEEGSVTKAAQKLHLTQPAVSNILRNLESVLACKLTEVLGRKIYLSPFGKLIYPKALDILQEVHELEEAVLDFRNAKTGELSIGLVTTAKYFVPLLVGRFKKEYPHILVKMNVHNRDTIIKRLEHNEDDFVIMSQLPQGLLVDSEDFYEDKLVVVAAQDYALDKEMVSLADLENQPWIIREIGSGTRIAMMQLFAQYKLQPNISLEISSTEGIKQAIIAGIGVSILSMQSIALELRMGLLKILNIGDFPVQHEWKIVRHKGKRLSPCAELFTNFARDHKSAFSLW